MGKIIADGHATYYVLFQGDLQQSDFVNFEVKCLVEESVNSAM
jgi:hypothetical protein